MTYATHHVGKSIVAALALLFAPMASAAHAEDDRIVALGGAVTEILYALGQQDKIAAVDTTSLYPADALKTKPNVGYFRAVSAEGVLSAQPTLVISVEGAGPPAALETLRQAGVSIKTVPDTPSAEGVSAKIKAIGRALHVEAEADKLAADVARRFSDLAGRRAQIERPKRVLFVLSMQNERMLVGGRGTAADAIIALAGGVNAAADIQGYKAMTDEALIAAAPDAIVMMAGGSSAKPEDIFARPALMNVPAAKTHAVITMDGLYLIGFGPRAPDAARDLMDALYPRTN